jgi:hypothetical protein
MGINLGKVRKGFSRGKIHFRSDNELFMLSLILILRNEVPANKVYHTYIKTKTA